jgi:hypothetical protein
MARTKKGGRFGFKRTDQRREEKEDDAGASSTSPRGRMTQRHSERKRNLQDHVFSRSVFERMGEEERNARYLNDRKISGSFTLSLECN